MKIESQLRVKTFRQFITALLILVLLMAPLQMQLVLAAELPRAVTRSEKEKKTSAHSVSRKKHAKGANQRLRFSANPSDAEIAKSRVFLIPLVPMDSKVLPKENTELANALLAFRYRKDHEDVSELTKFIAAHPNSRWRACLEMLLGQLRFDYGYLSDALKYWTAAWEKSKSKTKQPQKTVADEAISNLVLLEARLGHTDDLNKHIAEIRHRTLTGGAAERVKESRNGLWTQKNHPEVAFKCGPYAVSALSFLSKTKKVIECSQIFKAVPSTKQGTNLSQIADWAEQTGIELQMAKRSPGAKIIVPAVYHWGIGHFAAITQQAENRIQFEDSTFDWQGRFWLSKKAFEAGSDGYFLVPKGPLPPGWRSVSKTEAAKVWGRGTATAVNTSNNSGCPMNCRSCPCPMARASVFSLTTALCIVDYPLNYSPAVGPNFAFEAKYINGDLAPSNAGISNLGEDWNLNWVSFLTESGAGPTVTIRVRNGGYEKYDKVDGAYRPDLTTQARIEKFQDGSDWKYRRTLPDGSTEIFEQIYASSDYFMTEVLDQQGNAAAIDYDSDFRVTTITDASGNPDTTFTYVTPTGSPTDPGYYQIASITDGFSRSCQFGYDSSNQYLTSITDAGGNKSQFSYRPGSSFIDMMTTPYGQTSFCQYTPPYTGAYVPVGLRITYPDGSSSAIENWIGNIMETYYWDREACSRYPNDAANHDYSHCQTTRWTFGGAVMAMPVANWIRSASESPTFFSYPNATNQHILGTLSINQPIQIARQVTGFKYTATIGGSITAGDNLIINVIDDAFADAPAVPVEYTVQAGDTTATIATNMAAAMNANPMLQGFGWSCTPSGSTIIMTSKSICPSTTPYSFTHTGPTPTETISFANGPNPAQIESLSLSGTMQSGDVLTITVTDSALPGGSQAVSYTTQASDTLASVAQGLALVVNSNANLRALGVPCYWTGAYFGGIPAPPSGTKIALQSQSNSGTDTQFSFSVSSGSHVTFSLNTVSTNGIVQSQQFTRDTIGNVTKTIDPLGRQFEMDYSDDMVDLLEIRETKGIATGFADGKLIGHWEYNDSSAKHQPTLFVDGAAQKTQFAYSAPYYQLTSVVDSQGNTSTLSYGTGGYLEKIDGPLPGNLDVTNFSFFGYGPLSSITDSEGYSVSFLYDSLNRPTKATYPDGTFEQIAYDRLDPVWYADRLGRWSQFSFNNMDQLERATDPLGRTSHYCWCDCGSVSSITDPAGNKTRWHHDLEGRIIQKIYASGDTSAIDYSYDQCTGWLQSRTDALDQKSSFVHNFDSSLQYSTYSNSNTNPVKISYDTFYPRISEINNKSGSSGWGKYNYSYNSSIVKQSEPVVGGVFLQGRPTTGDKINIRVNNARLSGGTHNLQYTVSSGDTTLPALASSLATAVNNDSTFGGAGISATSFSNALTIKGVATEGLGGTIQANDTVHVYVYDDKISGSPKECWAPASASISATASALATQINNNLASVGITASAGNGAVTIVSTTGNPTSLRQEAKPAGSAQITITYSGNVNANTNGVATETLGGSITSGNIVSIIVNDAGISGGSQTFSHTVAGGDTLSSIAGTLASAISSSLSGIGISASTSGSSVVITSTSVNATTYSQSTSSGAAITISFSGGPSETAAGGAAPIAAGRLKTVTNDVISNSTTSYSFDAIGRPINRSINSTANSTNLSYDCINRLVSETNALGTFNYFYINDSTGASKGDGRLASISYPNGQSAVFSYFPNNADQRLREIKNLDSNSNILSQFNHSYNVAGEMIQWLQQQKSQHLNLLLAYDLASQLSSVKAGIGTTVPPFAGQSYFNFDCAANRAGVQQSQIQNAGIGGTPTLNDQITLTVKDSALSGGQKNIVYTVSALDTTTALLASGLAAAVCADNDMQTIGVNATASSSLVTLKSESANITSYSSSVSSSNETVTIGTNKSVQNVTIGGTVNTGDVLTLTIRDPQISGNPISKNYTVLVTDTLSTIATAITALINADTNLAAAGITATSANQVIAVQSLSANVTAYSTSVSGSGATTTISAGQSLNGSINSLITGTAAAGDLVKIKVIDAGISAGSKTASYTIQSGDSPTVIASGIASAINSDTDLKAIGVTASSTGAKLTVTSFSTNLSTYLPYTSNSGGTSPGTETIVWNLPANGTQTAAIGGSKSTGDILTISVFDKGLSGGSKAISHTVLATDNLDLIALALATNINADTDLQGIGVTASSRAAVVNITSASNNATMYTSSLSNGATETIALGTNIGASKFAFDNLNQLTGISAGGPVRFEGSTANSIKSAVVNVSQTATISGTAASNHTLYFVVHNSSLAQAKVLSISVSSGTSTTDIASAVASAVNSDSTLSPLGVTASSTNSVITVNSASSSPTWYGASTSVSGNESIAFGASRYGLGIVSPSNIFSAEPLLASGTNSVKLTALSGGGTATSVTYPLSVVGASSQVLTYDLNGNTTSDGSNTLAWNAEDSLLTITYPGSNNHSDLTYDPLFRWTKLDETTSGSTTTKQFLWCGAEQCEVRESNGALTNGQQFFGLGQINFSSGTGTKRFFELNHLGNVVGVTDNNGAEISAFAYNAYGIPTLLSGSYVPDFGFAGMYQHPRSSFNLTLFRQYSAPLGRWLSRDPLGEAGGLNLYGYVGNNPISNVDPLGLLFGGMVNAGEGYGQSAMNYWADQSVNNPNAFARAGATTMGLFAALWTPCTSDNTASTLGSALVPNLTTWAKNPILYEIGQKTLPLAEFQAIPQGLSAIERGAHLVQTQGWVKAILPRATSAYAQTMKSGATPGGAMGVIWGTNLGTNALTNAMGTNPCNDPCSGK